MSELRIIGRIHTGFSEAAGTPIQPCYAGSAEGTVVVNGEYVRALDDLDGFERIWLIYWMHRADPFAAHVIPYRDTRERGLLATRSPCRPNPIGMSAVRLVGREGNTLRVAGVDMLDDTPLLDIKPYVPAFDAHTDSAAGWFDHVAAGRTHADARFHKGEAARSNAALHDEE